MKVIIFWEDSAGVAVKNFGPHRLLQECLKDDGVDSEQVKMVYGHPVKGYGNVIPKLRKLPPPLTDRSPYLGVLDWDRAPRLALLPKSSGYCTVRTRLGTDVVPPRLIVFLNKNIETLLKATSDVLKISPPDGKLDPNARDRIFQRLWSNPALNSERRQLREQVESFNYLVNRVHELVDPREVS